MDQFLAVSLDQFLTLKPAIGGLLHTECQLSFVVFWGQLSGIFFFEFPCLISMVENSLFFTFLKHCKNSGFKGLLFFVAQPDEKRQKMITGTSGFGFFLGPKMAVL